MIMTTPTCIQVRLASIIPALITMARPTCLASIIPALIGMTRPTISLIPLLLPPILTPFPQFMMDWLICTSLIQSPRHRHRRSTSTRGMIHLVAILILFLDHNMVAPFLVHSTAIPIRLYHMDLQAAKGSHHLRFSFFTEVWRYLSDLPKICPIRICFTRELEIFLGPA